MNKKYHNIFPCLVVLLLTGYLSACSMPPTKASSVNIKRLVFLNQSSIDLNNVRIHIAKTNEVVTCGYILPKSECSTGFPLREYQGNRFDISWVDRGQPKSMKNIQVEVPGNLQLDKPVNALVIYSEQGRFSAKLQH